MNEADNKTVEETYNVALKLMARLNGISSGYDESRRVMIESVYVIKSAEKAAMDIVRGYRDKMHYGGHGNGINVVVKTDISFGYGGDDKPWMKMVQNMCKEAGLSIIPDMSNFPIVQCEVSEL